MVNTNNRESRKHNITNNEDINSNYWINGLLTWWSGFSLRTKLLAIATLVVSLLMTGITFFALNTAPSITKTQIEIKTAMVTSLVKAALASAFFCLLYTSPSPRDRTRSRMPSSA